MTSKKVPPSKLFKASIVFAFLIASTIQSLSAQNCSVNAGVAETICENTSYMLSGSASGLIADGPTWSQVAGPSLIIDNPSSLNTGLTGLIGGNVYTFRLSATCTDNSVQFQDVSVTVLPITISQVGEDLSSCPDSSGSIIVNGNSPGNPGEAGFWSVVGGNSGGVTVNFPNDASTTLTLAEGSAGVSTLRWTITGPTTGGVTCESFDEIEVTNFGGQDPVDAGPDQALDNCYTVSQSTQLNASFGGSNLSGQQGTWSFVSGPSSPSIGQPNNNTTGVSGLIEGTYVLRWSVVGPCVTGQDTMTITVDEATQDVTQASIQDRNQAFCDPSITSATLRGNPPEFAGETVLWEQISGPTAGVTITNPTSNTTEVTGLSSPNSYGFRYTITNASTNCTSSNSGTVIYNPNNITLVANGGADIVEEECNKTNIDIPFTSTGGGTNQYRILSGPSDSSFSYPTSFQNFNDASPLNIQFDEEGTYAVEMIRRQEGQNLSGCQQAADIINVTISRIPTASNAGTGQNLACGVTSSSLAGNIVSVGTSSWSQISGPNTATITDPSNRLTDINNLIEGTYIFRYIVSGEANCPANESDVQVFVSSSTNGPANAGSDQTICFGSPIQLAGNIFPEGQEGTWTQTSGPDTVTFADSSDPNTTVSGLNTASSDYILTWTIDNPTVSCGPPSTDTVTISTNATQGPSTADAGTDQCLPVGTTTVNINGNEPGAGEQGLWTVVPNNGGLIFTDDTAFNTTASIIIEDSYIATWTISNVTPGCQPTSDDVELTIGGSAAAFAGDDQNECDNTITMSATSSTDDGLWTQISGPGGFTINDDTSPIAIFTFTNPGIFVFDWTVNNGSCSTDSDEVQIQVGIPPTTAITGGAQTICNATNVVLSGNNFDTNSESGIWSILTGAPNTPNIADITDPNTNVTGLITGSYTFRWSISGSSNCPSSFADVVVDVFAAANAGGDQALCNATNVLLEATKGSTGTWSEISGLGATITQDPSDGHTASAQIIPGNTYVFEFETNYPAGSGCTNQTDQVTVVNSSPPSIAPDAGTDQLMCQADLAPSNTITLSGNTAPGDVDTATWRFASQPTGSVATIDTPNSNNSTISNLSVPGIYILEWNFASGNCTDVADVVRIEIFEAPSTAQAGTDQPNACQLNAQLSADVPTVGIGTWSFANAADDPSSGAVVIDSPNSPTTTLSNITTLGTYTLTWIVTNGNFVTPSSCAPSIDTIDITFTDVPASDANAGPDQELCDVTQTTLNATSVGIGSGTWTQIAGAPTTITAPNNPNSLINGLAPGTYEYEWSTNNNSSGCSFTDIIAVVVLEQPANANAGLDQTVPQFSGVTLSADPASVGVGTWTQVSGPTTANFIDVNDPTTGIIGTDIGTYEFQWTVTNGICAETSDAVIVTIIGISDLELTKIALPTTANVGDTVTFTISIFNNDTNSTTDATGVAVADFIPTGYTFVLGSASNDATYNTGNLSLTWDDLVIPIGNTLDLTFQATVNPTGDYTNSAEITASDQADPDSTVDNNTATEDDQDTASITILTADLSLVKSVSPAQASIGETVTFTLAVTNAGTDNATGVSLVDNIPVGYTLSAINDGGILNGNVITWSGITVNDAATTNVTFTATVNQPSGAFNEYVNTAQISASDVFDPDSSPNNDDGDQSEDDESNVGIILENADLEISKSSVPVSGNIGDVVTFTIAVFNNDAVETGDATGVEIVDILPNGFELVAGSVNNGGNFNFGNNTISWDNLNIANGATTNLTYQVTVNGNGNYTNTAQVTGSDLSDPDSSLNNDNGDQSEDDEDNSVFALQTADLRIAKGISAASSATPNVGDTVTFEITVTNDGPDTAENVVVMDLISSGYSIGTINDGGSSGGNFITWDILSIAPGAGNAVTVSFDAIVNETGDYKNTAEILFSDQFDPDSEPGNDDGDQSEDDESSFTVDPQQVDLSLSKTVDNSSPNVGEMVTFTLSLTNSGADAATGVSVEDILPAGYTLVTVPTGTATGNTANWINQTVAGSNGTLVLSYTATVNAPTGTAGEYDNAAQITAADQFDADSTPNNDDGDQSEDDEDGTTVTPQVADISLEKTADTSSPNVGDTVSFTLTLTNAGPSIATGVAVEDILPAGFTLLSATGGNLTGNTASWVNQTIAANNGELELIYTATVNPPTGTVGEYLNQAQVTATDQYDPDSSANNNDPNEDDQDALEIIPESADLSISKSVIDGSTTPNVGDILTFELILTNAGPNIATNVAVEDILPIGFTLLTVNNGGATSGNTASWSALSIPANGNRTLTYRASVNAIGPYVNAAQITASDQYDPNSDPTSGFGTDDLGDSNADDDETTLTIVPQSADLSIVKSVSDTNPNFGDTITFSVQVNNAGSDNATNVTIEDSVPSGYSVVNGTVSDGGIFNSGGSTVLWNLANVSLAGSTLTYQVIVNTPTGAVNEYLNSAQITASDQIDIDSDPQTGFGVDDLGDGIADDDEDTATITVQTADLRIAKGISAASSATPNVGDTVTFEITVANDGPDTAENVVVMDLISSGYSIGTINDGGSSGGNFITWDILSIAPGAGNAVTVSFDAIVNETGDYKNTAEILFSDQFDPDSEPGNEDGDQSEDDEDSFTIDPQQVDLSLSKTVDNSSPNVGEMVTFTLSLTNSGADAATGVSVEDILPAGYTLVTVPTGTATGNTANWINQTVAGSNGTLVLSYTATVNAPTGTADEYDNAAQITAADQFDADSTPNNDDGDQSEDDEDGTTVAPQVADISLEKTADTSSPNVGDTVSFTLTLTNAGPSIATGVAVEDILPAGFTLLSATGGNLTGNTASWVNQTIAANNGELELIYTATVNPPTGTVGEYLNQAQVTATDQYDPDSSANNNDPNEDDQDALEVVPNSGDLSLTKIVVDNDITPIVGSEITFEITVFNDGPNDATSVVVEDQLPSGYDFVLFSSTAGLYNEITGIWTVGNVASGGSETLLIDVLVNATGVYENIAEVTASDVFDNDSTPNNDLLNEDDQDNASVTPMQIADVSLEKSVNSSTPDVNTNVTFTIEVTNDGPSEATNLVVSDQLPTGYTYVSDDAGAAYDSASGLWSIGTLINGASVTLDIVANVNTTGDYTNVAEVTTMDQIDSDSTPNNDILAEDDQDEVVVTPRPIVDISVTKVASTLTPNVGSQIDFNISVTNDGPSDATTVVVTDLLASGYDFVSATPSIGTYEPLNGSWTVGNLPTGVTQTLTISANVLSNGVYTNTAELTDLEEFDIDSEPANNDDTEDDQETVNPAPVLVSDLSLTKSVDNTTPLVGENIEFTIDLFNAGPNDARGVVVTDQLSSGYTYVSHTATAGSYDEATGIWNINGILFDNTTETLNVLVTVNPTGDYSNVAEITASDNDDPNSIVNNGILAENDQDEQNTTPIPLADLSLTKTVDNEFPDVSDNVTFTLVLNNEGPSEATGVVVTDLLESGYSYVSDDSGGSYNATNGEWAVGSLASENSITLNILVGINTSGTYGNVAQVTGVNELDPNSTPGNNDLTEDDQDEQSTLPRVITDLSLIKTVDNLSPSVGDQIVFTIAVTNDGPSDATGVIIEDMIASGYNFESAISSIGSYDESIGSWDVNNLANGVTETLEITVTVLPNGEYSNIAELIALDTFDPDSSPDNNLNSEDDQDTVNPMPTGLADLSLTKVVDNMEPNVGDTVEFTLNLTNSGDSDATGVVVTDLLPVGYTYISHLTTIGIYDEVIGEWITNGTIPNGTTETLIILASINSPSGTIGEYLNIAEITASDQSDPDSDIDTATGTDDFADGLEDDDEASAFVVPQVTDIAITKVVSNNTPNIGAEVIFTITASNESMMIGTNIGVEEVLPSGYQFVSAATSNGVFDPSEGFWSIPEITPNGVETLELTVIVLEPDDYLNTASLAYLDQIDLNMTNDSAQAFVTPSCLHVFNEFSPNDDGVNDFFKIECISRYPNNILKVYNRWGNIVFEQQGYDNTWEGTSNGRATVNTEKQLPVGTYFYVLDLGDGSQPTQDWLYINR